VVSLEKKIEEFKSVKLVTTEIKEVLMLLFLKESRFYQLISASKIAVSDRTLPLPRHFPVFSGLTFSSTVQLQASLTFQSPRINYTV
jgi:hypothetical protein